MIDNLALIRDILLRSFIVGLIFLVIASITYCYLAPNIVNVSVGLYGIKAEDVPLLIVSFIGIMKAFLYFVFLIPAIAIHWTIKALPVK